MEGLKGPNFKLERHTAEVMVGNTIATILSRISNEVPRIIALTVQKAFKDIYGDQDIVDLHDIDFEDIFLTSVEKTMDFLDTLDYRKSAFDRESITGAAEQTDGHTNNE